MKRILFDVNTPFQLLIACTISEIYYKEDDKTLLLSNSLLKDLENLKERIITSTFFSRVHIINEKISKEEIIKQIQVLNIIEKTDIFHFSSYSTVFSCYIYNNLPNSSTIILNEEGAASYDLFNKYSQFRENFPNLRADVIDLNKLNRIYLLNEKLYISERKDLINQIKINKIKDIKSFIKKLNAIYNYYPKSIKEKAIFFTQNFIDYNIIKKDEIIDFCIKLKEIYKDEIIFKLHPFDKLHEMYNSLNIKYLDINSQIPWELIVYNEILDNKVFEKTLLSVGSTSLASEQMYLKDISNLIKTKNILLIDIFHTPFNKNTNIFYSNLSKKTSFKYFCPKNYKELNSLYP